jgi:hypothetical protein
MQRNPPESDYLDGASSWTQAQSGALTGQFRTFGNREIAGNELGIVIGSDQVLGNRSQNPVIAGVLARPTFGTLRGDRLGESSFTCHSVPP